MLSDETRRALLRGAHRSVSEAVDTALRPEAGTGSALQLTYPPGATCGPEERERLAALCADPALKDALVKLLNEVAGSAIFKLFCIIDGVSDPPGAETWLGVDLNEPGDDDDVELFLHDAFLESYGRPLGSG